MTSTTTIAGITMTTSTSHATAERTLNRTFNFGVVPLSRPQVPYSVKNGNTGLRLNPNPCMYRLAPYDRVVVP